MNERPLSPHLQVYRLPLTAVLSILHRATGVFLSIGMAFLVLYLMALAEGAASFETVLGLLRSILGRLFLWGWIFALLFHLVHGIRHLVWDTVHGFERETLRLYSLYEIGATVFLVVLVFFLSLFF